jgi:RNA polymerase sigma-70 factor (ECF subfamily)
VSETSRENQQTAAFVRDFSENSREIYRWIRTLLPHQDSADDVFQETSAKLWEKYSQFESGTNFAAWARQIAYFKVLEYRRRHAREPLVFGPEYIEAMAETAEALSESADLRRRLLAECFQKLSFNDRRIVQQRYQPGASTQSVAEFIGRNVSFVYRALRRAHEGLFRCIESGLGREGVQ